MITIFNRKELFVTYDMNKQGEIRLMLDNHGIPTKLKVTERLSASPFGGTDRARMGSFGVDQSKSKEYKVYVKKADYDKAEHLMNSNK